MNVSSKFHSIWPPFAWITSSSLLRKLLAALHRVFWGILSHDFSKERFRASTDPWDEAQASASKMDHTEKSIGFRSGDEGGQSSLLQKLGKLSWHHFWVLFDVCDGAPSCWKVNGFSLKCFFASWSAGVKINSMYEFVFTFAPWGTKMRRDFHVLDMAAQTMTDEGFWRLKTRFTESGMSPDDFARILSFCRLQIASTVNNFSSEKMISSGFVPSFSLLRRIVAWVNCFSFCRSVRFWQVCILSGNNLSLFLTSLLEHCFFTHVHVTSHSPHWSLWVALNTSFDSFDELWSHSTSRSSTSRSICSISEFFKSLNSVIDCRFWSFNQLHNLRVCLARAVKLYNCFAFSVHSLNLR